MLAKRIIPCLDLKQGEVVKGINFTNLRTVGNPLKLAQKYYQEGADELSILDITASSDQRKPLIKLIQQINKQIFIPLCVGGGIGTLADAQKVLEAGAEKVSIGTAAVRVPRLIQEIADQYGRQAVVLSLDLKRVLPSDTIPSGYEVYIFGGKQPTSLDGVNFAKKMITLGVGELLLNAIDTDGCKLGYDLQMLQLFSSNCTVPIIASGGAGSLDDFYRVFIDGHADAALAASIFHFDEITIPEIKSFLQTRKIEVRN